MYSIVIPVYNEHESLGKLTEEIAVVARDHELEYEIIFVDDGSNDGSWKIIEELSQTNDPIQGIRFRRNFGKAAALNAGFEAASGEVVFTMDADLQDDPQEIPRFLAEMDKGFDVISGWKQVRHDPIHKTFPSKIFNWLAGALTGVKLHDHNCGFKCYRREIFDEVFLYGELHRFIPVLAAARGWTVGEVIVNHRAREFGQSKYGFRRFIKGFLDLMTVYFLTGFRQRPQHLLGTVGFGSFGLGALGLTYLGIYWIVTQVSGSENMIPLHERPMLLYSVGALLLGAQLVSIGILAELITAYQGRRKDTYSIKQTTDGGGDQTIAKAASQAPDDQPDEEPIQSFPLDDPAGLHAESNS